jgi:hypothetical protein
MAITPTEAGALDGEVVEKCIQRWEGFIDGELRRRFVGTGLAIPMEAKAQYPLSEAVVDGLIERYTACGWEVEWYWVAEGDFLVFEPQEG